MSLLESSFEHNDLVDSSLFYLSRVVKRSQIADKMLYIVSTALLGYSLEIKAFHVSMTRPDGDDTLHIGNHAH